MNIRGITNINHYTNTKLSDSDKAELKRRTALDKVSPKEALMAALATAPNNDDVESSKALAAKFAPIQNKILSGKQLTPEEKQFLQKYYPGYLSSAKIDSIEISSQAYKLQEELLKMSARSGKET